MSKINTTIKERVLYFAENQESSKQDFFRKTGLKYSNFTGKSKNSDLASLSVAEILLNYPIVNPYWLITGKGDMLNESIDESCNIKETQGNNIPLYNAEASAGIGQLQLENEHIISTLKVPFARAEDIALTIVGDSMTPAMHSGDLAVVRNMPNWLEYLDYGNIFVVVTESEVYCKIIAKNSNPELLSLKSLNSNYDEFEIPKKFITQIYKVIGTVSQRSY